MASLMMALKRRQHSEDYIFKCGSVKGYRDGLAPLMEGPTPENFENGKRDSKWGTLQWMKGQLLTRTSSSSRPISRTERFEPPVGPYRRSDLRLLLGVLGAPLAPVAVAAMESIPQLSVKTIPMETSSAQYIIQQYVCATGAAKLTAMRNSYTMGRVKMSVTEFENSSQVVRIKNSSKSVESGFFVMWQMTPSMWNVEMAVAGSKVHAGSNGKLVWRHTPWLGSHASKGPVRPLRRALQGLDPRTIASMFWKARCIGEKQVRGEDCFILKLVADPTTLASRSEYPAEIVRHVLFGYFSQRTGLLVQVEDSHLTRIQSSSGDVVSWETNIDSTVDDYREVEGVMVAHAGKSVVTLFRFGEVAMSHTRTRLEEEWAIDEVAFDVEGLSTELFMAPADIHSPIGEVLNNPHQHPGAAIGGGVSVSSATAPLSNSSNSHIIWRVEV
ncbi:hypothetical protein KP509_25G061800 [Ceratopteris richardii]|uniref:Uncharacterized protein n=1 Tax=Ceratopteris richardii TaxID=49495 RepID=A0A8T2RTN1_CERRI|nr:hypothetical protein KP509_25G061800 [Ceratopteris richardii]KAH7298858.1 hypothetical protein KP509_25G061800 [Ceratopteris richardii]